MTKDELAKIIDGMPQGMNVDDYLLEVVNRALFLERRAILDAIQEEIQGWDKDYRSAVTEALEVIDRRGLK